MNSWFCSNSLKYNGEHAQIFNTFPYACSDFWKFFLPIFKNQNFSMILCFFRLRFIHQWWLVGKSDFNENPSCLPGLWLELRLRFRICQKGYQGTPFLISKVTFLYLLNYFCGGGRWKFQIFCGQPWLWTLTEGLAKMFFF